MKSEMEDSSDSSSTERRKRKEKKAKKKAKKQKKSKKSSRDIDVESSVAPTPSDGSSSIADRLRLLAEPMCGPDLSLATMPEAVKPKGPMTKEQWEKHQTTLRKVHDPETGRTRLIRGDGEIMEEIVTRDMHIAINKSATKADGAFFETVLGLKRHK
ncbi:putative ADP-ribosylation factor-like protein 6-interacting protein 4 [Hypsibius exemplaris]|uniref:ADP-ribosylation factor-like protein 6-interacting protein 4 n=1 Tax=Hypsibius exemplaris TaxID=2072580 RepID=A0A9X6NFU6_HYPEX|nr:putative ADP-ribosylation factor-like protein 6-interacting protein 4 [Hypsibius exemplaris]